MVFSQTQLNTALQQTLESLEIQKAHRHDDDSWHYFLALENDFCNSLRYVDLSEENDTTFSIDFARQLVCICTEFESVAKELCKTINEAEPRGNIGNYKAMILTKFPEITEAPVYIDRYKRKIYPFENWDIPKQDLEWWDAYGDIKHDRSENFEKATVRNTLEALCALLLLKLYQHSILFPECEMRKGGTTLLRAPSMIEPLFAQPAEDLPHYPKTELPKK